MGSSTLTIVLGSLLIVAGVVGLILFNRSRRTKSSYRVPPVRSRTPEQELSDLGILEIRAKPSEPKEPAIGSRSDSDEEGQVFEVELGESSEEVDNNGTSSPEQGEEPDEDTLELDIQSDEQSGEDQEEGPLGIEENTSTNEDQFLQENGFIQDATVLSETSSEVADAAKRIAVSRREALFRMMNAIQASVDGNTACLVKKERDGVYTIEAIVSQNPQTIKVGSSSLSATLIDDKNIEESAVSVLEIKSSSNSYEKLGYYKIPVDIRQVAIARVKIPDNRDIYYLFIDALAWQDLDDPWQRLMISQFATLLGTYMATPQLDEKGSVSDKLRLRPRREIIEEEMAKARRHNHPLALALVYLNQAEEVAQEGPKAVRDAEKAFEQLLHEILEDVRIERFGELTYGIFHEDSVTEVEARALLMQEEIESKGGFYFKNGVSIGIALLQDRHNNADDLRSDATEALRESFETGACTIIE